MEPPSGLQLSCHLEPGLQSQRGQPAGLQLPPPPPRRGKGQSPWAGPEDRQFPAASPGCGPFGCPDRSHLPHHGSPGAGSGPVLLISLTSVASPGLALEATVHASWIKARMKGLEGEADARASPTRLPGAHSRQADEQTKWRPAPALVRRNSHPTDGWRPRNPGAKGRCGQRGPPGGVALTSAGRGFHRRWAGQERRAPPGPRAS